MHGAATDNNATQFAQGYDSVIDPLFKSGKWKDVANDADTWDPPTAETEFQEAYTAHPGINAALIPNDETGAPIVTYLQSLHIAPMTFPTTGQDHRHGPRQCADGLSVRDRLQPIYVEASAASALAIYLRANRKPPSSLVNGKTADTQFKVSVSSILLTPEYVTTKNMNATIIADNFVPASQLCAGTFGAPRTAAGITP
jgi:D-xylose transport system substrate-binding protein